MRKFLSAILLSMVMSVSAVANAQPVQCIDVDNASAKELTALKGVGDDLAKRIIDYRKRERAKATREGRKVWGFRNWQTLMKVKGIGPKICQDNVDVVCFSGKIQKSCPAAK